MTINGVHHLDKLITVANCPGYRDVGIQLSLTDGAGLTKRVEVRLSADDAQALLVELVRAHRLAWHNGKPLDAREGERRPNDLLY